MRYTSRGRDEEESAARRSEDRISAWSYPRVGGDSYGCSVSVTKGKDNNTMLQIVESKLKERGVGMSLELPPEPLVMLVLEAVERLVDDNKRLKDHTIHMEAKIDKLAYIAASLAGRLDKKGEEVLDTDFGFEGDNHWLYHEYDFLELADRLIQADKSDS